MWIFGSVVQVPAGFAALGIAQFLHCRRIGAKPVGDNLLGRAVALQRLLQESQSRGSVTFLGDVGLQNLAFVIDGAPQVVHLAIDLDVHLVEVPAPVPEAPHPSHPLATDVRGEQRLKSIPLQPHRLMAKDNPALEKQILDIALAQREADVQHDHEPDHFRR